MPSAIIKGLFYISPYAALPPGISTAGITLQTVPAQSPTPTSVTNPILVMRLRMASSPVVIGISATSGPGTGVATAIFQPSFPLSATESYMIDLIWVTSGTPPENIDWDAAIASAPITAAEVMISNAAFDTSSGTAQLTANLAYGASGIGIGAQANVYALSGGVYVKVGSAATEGTQVTVPVNGTGYPQVYFVSAQAVIPVTNAGGAASFTAPFSVGPPTIISNRSGVPQAIKSLTTATYNGSGLVLNWALDTIAGCVDPDSSLIQIVSGNKVIASFTGGPLSASLPFDAFNGQSSLSVQVRSIAGVISSTPLSFNLITQAPPVTMVTNNITSHQVTAAVTVPAGLTAQGYLMNGNAVLAGPIAAVNGVISFASSTQQYNVAGMVGLSVVANITSADGKISGPLSQPAVLLATAPVLQSATIQTDPANPAQWRMDVVWDRLPDRASDIVSYTVNVLQDTSVALQTTTGTTAALTFLKTAIDTTKTQTIQLSATGATGGASPSQVLYALFTPPLLSSLVTTAQQIAATWTAPAIPAGNTQPVSYQLSVLAGNTIIYSSRSISALRGAIPLSEVPVAGAGSIAIQSNISLGPVSLITDPSMAAACSATPLLAVPALLPASAAPLTNIATVNWQPVTGAAAYNVYFTQGNPVTDITGTLLALSAALIPGQQLGYAVQATGVSNGVALSGPVSDTAWIPSGQADISWARFNGTKVSLAWNAVPAALYYNVFVFDTSTPANQIYAGGSTDTSAVFSITITAGKTYRAYVQPVLSNGTALGGQPASLFNAGLFVSQQPISAAYPYVYPAYDMPALGTASAGPVANAITLYLPELGLAAGSLGTTPIQTDPFTIEPSGNTALPYKLTIAADALAWGFDTNQIRALLQSAYVTFLKNIETPPAGALAGATPYGISLVQSAIACMLPQTFAEQLYYSFGFSPDATVARGYIDLRPGMILRVIASDYISIAQTTVPTFINGYTGGTVMDFEIGSYLSGNTWKVGFDSFLSTLAAQNLIDVNTPANPGGLVQAGLAAAADLYFEAFRQPFHRLYFPPDKLSSPWSTGSNLTTANFTLVAAAKYDALQKTTIDPSRNPTAYFRGRTIVEVMIRIQVNGSERLVPVGTTLGNILEQLQINPVATSTICDCIRVYRSVAAAVTSTDITTAQAPWLELRTDWNGLAGYGTGNGFTAMQAPLLQGDQIFTDKTGK